MKQARRVAQELPAETLDTLILTTGIFAGKQRMESPEGIEIDLAVSYLSRFVIVREVAERLGKKRAVANLKLREAELSEVQAGLRAAATRFEQPVH